MAEGTRFKELDKRVESQEQRLVAIGGQLEKNEERMDGVERSMEELKIMMLELGGKVDAMRKQKQTIETQAPQNFTESNSSTGGNGGGMPQGPNQNTNPVVSRTQSLLVSSIPDPLILQPQLLHNSLPSVTAPLQNSQASNQPPIIHHQFNQKQQNPNPNFIRYCPPNQPPFTHTLDNQAIPPHNLNPTVLQNTQPYHHHPPNLGQNPYWVKAFKPLQRSSKGFPFSSPKLSSHLELLV